MGEYTSDDREQGGPVPEGAWSPDGPGSIPGVMPAAAPASGKRKGKGKGCMVSLLVVLLLMFAVCGGVALLVPSGGDQVDLGVQATQADFDSATQKVGVELPKDPPNGDWDSYERVYTGEKPLDVTLTATEVSALMSYNHGSGYWPVSNVQIRFLGGNEAEASAIVTYMGRDYPVYAVGSAGISGKTLSSNISEAQVMGISVPETYLEMGSGYLDDMVNARLARIPGFDIETLEVQGDQVHANGTIWESAEWVEK